jgi:hypothetical protein
MSKIILMALCFYVFCSPLIGQELIDKQYFKSIYHKRPTKEKRAKVVRLRFKQLDGVIMSEYRSLDNNNLLQVRRYKNDLPFGQWVTISQTTGKEFVINYRSEPYDSILVYDDRKQDLLSEYSGQFTPPRIKNKEQSISSFIARKSLFPVQAQQNGIQGVVQGQFIIDETGHVESITIKQGIHPLIDFECIRAIGRLPEIIPAQLDGENIKVQMIVESIFKIRSL